MQNEIDIGEKIIEMADVAREADVKVPGAQATWGFEMDDVQYRVVVTVVRPEPPLLAMEPAGRG